MPVKKRTAKKPLVESKASAKQAVKQVVNVKIGDKVTTRRRRVARVPKIPPAEPSPLLRERSPINLSLSTQSYNQPPVQPLVNEYNMLLRQLAEERTARARAAPPLQPNNSPLTTNLQRNELLNRREPKFTDQTFPVVNIMDEVVNRKVYDDPLTDENMFVNSSRLAENLAPKLFIDEYFDYNDLNKYADENLREQEEVINEVEKEKKPKNKKVILYDEEGNLILPQREVEEMAKGIVSDIVTKATKKPTKKEKLLDETNNLIQFYNKETNDNINLVKMTSSKKEIQAQNDRIKSLIDSRALKVSKSKR